MTRLSLSRKRFPVRSGAGLALLALAGVLAACLGPRSGTAGPPTAAVTALATTAATAQEVGPDIELPHVLGVAAGDCKKCHAPAVAHWMTTKHYNSEKMLLAENAAKYAAAMKIPVSSVRTSAMCVRCHATATETGGQLRAISGVSCESCHGAAGGEDGWLNPHAVYGPNMAKREQETKEHFQERIARIEKAGMIRSANIYEMARNCYQCHLVGSEQLVAAGHKFESSNFDVLSWLHGEVRHNFFLNPEKNAEAPTLWMAHTGGTPQQRKRLMYVASVLADLEMSLRNRATAKTPAYIATISGRVAAINGAKLPPLAAVPEVAPVMGKIAQAFGRMFAPMPDDEKYFNELADFVAESGKKFVEAHDGSKLQFVDPLIPAPKKK